MFCNDQFSTVSSLNRHQDKHCSAAVDKKRIQQTIQNLLYEKESVSTIVTDSNNVSITNNQNSHNTTTNTATTNVTIIVNPVENLDYSRITNEQIHKLVSEYTHDTLNTKLSDLLSKLIANPGVPENNCVKWITRNPPVYSIKTIDINGDIVQVIRNLKEACDTMKNPVLDGLNKRLTSYMARFVRPRREDLDVEDIKDNLQEIRRQLKDSSVYKTLNTVLRNDVLNEYKLKLDSALH
jgi:hypothetical protein